MPPLAARVGAGLRLPGAGRGDDDKIILTSGGRPAAMNEQQQLTRSAACNPFGGGVGDAG